MSHCIWRQRVWVYLAAWQLPVLFACSDRRPEAEDAVVAAASTVDTVPLFDFQVDVPADILPPIPRAKYPEALRKEGIEGKVEMAFVVDTAGQVEPSSINVRSATHRFFGEAAREALLKTTFLPAQLRGKKVRQLVIQPYEFNIRK